MAEIRGCLFPDDLFYDVDLNLWLKPIDESAWEIGMTEFGLALVGEIYMFNPKPMNRQLELDEPFALIEVAKTILTVKTPFSSTLIRSNDEMAERPIRINKGPFENWLVHLKAEHPEKAKELLITGEAVSDRALELMELNRFTSLEAFKKTGGNR
jgi:glycine cleavage system H protein